MLYGYPATKGGGYSASIPAAGGFISPSGFPPFGKMPFGKMPFGKMPFGKMPFGKFPVPFGPMMCGI